MSNGMNNKNNIDKISYRSANEYFKSIYGHKMYKVSVSLNVTCPNRDGTVGEGGCIFCSEGGSGEFATSNQDSITKQIDDGIDKLRNKVSADTGYICYFQSFTNTYCAPEYLKEVLAEAFRHPQVEACSIATRPDCLGNEIIKVLKEFACDRANDDSGIKCHMNVKETNKPRIFVELGLQTANDDTAQIINRCYKTEVYEEAVQKLHSINVNVITHIIFGLPGEGAKDMLNTVKFVMKHKSEGIKFTCLYILKNTKVENLYNKSLVKPLSMEEYFDIIGCALKLVNKETVIHRLTGDGPKNLLIAPEWTRNKRNVINYINRHFEAIN